MDDPAIPAALDAGLRALALPFDDAQRAQLLAYLALIVRWNAAYNLSAVRDPRDMVTKHLLDSLAVVPHLDALPLADLGSGAGLPGIPIAIAQPERALVLVESNGKKARFLRECVRALPLPRVSVVAGRAEAGAGTAPRGSVVARALASLDVLCRYAAPWLAPGGRLYAMKGPDHAQELAALPEGFEHESTRALSVPGLDAGRWLVVLKRPAD
jgi:16S rRNA (guanine527-N7)-methyltransferase